MTGPYRLSLDVAGAPPATQPSPDEPERPVEVGDFPQVRFLIDRESFSAGDRFQLEVQTVAGVDEEPVDLYIAVQLPDGTLLFFTANLFAPVTRDFAAYRTNISVNPATILLLDILLPEGLEGDYEFLAAFIRAGEEPNLFNIVGDIERLRVAIE